MFGINDANNQPIVHPEPTAHSHSPMPMHSVSPGLPDAPPSGGPTMSSFSNVTAPVAPPAVQNDHGHPATHPINEGHLMDIKQQALSSLTPLVGQIDQTPEEKFKTTMMLIQASDNSSLIKDAYAAANQIKDEKARAQALIDVINEINYFTQHHGQPNL